MIRKKIMAITLSVLLVFAGTIPSFSGIAVAEVDPGGGSDVIEISSAEQFYELSVNQAVYLDKHIVLTDDIDFTGWNWETDGWWAIGTDDDPFIGTFDGQGHKITGFNIHYAGMFGVLSGIIQNITFKGAKIIAGQWDPVVGVVAGVSKGGTISNVVVIDSTVMGDRTIGGLVGYNAGTIIDSSVTGLSSVTGNAEVGGLVGMNGSYNNPDDGIISNSYSTADVDGTTSVGGLVGKNNGAINESYTTGNVTGGSDNYIINSEIGGLVGNNVGMISGSYATGKVSGNMNVGGLAGSNSGDIKNSHASGQVDGEDCEYKYIDNVYISLNNSIGGLVGLNHVYDSSIGSIVDSDSEGIVTGFYGVGGLVGKNVGGIIEYARASGAVAGTASIGGLIGFSKNFDSNFDNIYEQQGSVNYSYASGKVSGIDSVGGLVGYNEGSVIITSSASGDVTGEDNAAEKENIGGLIGNNREGSITDSHAFGDVIGLDNSHNVGGLIGRNDDGSVERSSAAGNISGIRNVGGFVGYNMNFQSGRIKAGFALGKVEGNLNIGGFVGVNSVGNIEDSYAFGDVVSVGGWIAEEQDMNQPGTGGFVGYNEEGQITNSYSAGSVTSFVYAGGFAGQNEYGGTIENSYWKKNAGDSILGVGATVEGENTNDVRETTTDQMRKQATFTGWDFAATWSIAEGISYPYLTANPQPMLIDLQVYGNRVAGFNAYNLGPYNVSVSNAKGSVNIFYKAASGEEKTITEAISVGSNSIEVAIPAKGGSDINYRVIIVRDNPPSSGSGGGSGSGGSSSAGHTPVDGSTQIPAGGSGTVSLGDAITLTIPAGSSSEALRITIDKVLDLSGLIEDRDELLSEIYELLKDTTGKFDKPVTIAITFDSSKLQPGQKASIFYFDEATKQWVEIGGTASGNIITAEVDHFTKFAVFAVATEPVELPAFTDTSGHWAESAIMQAVAKKIVNGYLDNTFRPNATITRAEFTVMLANALKPGKGSVNPIKFSDEIPVWAQEAVDLAVTNGWVSGDGNNRFRAGDPITRAEMVKMLGVALGWKTDEIGASAFADRSLIPAWALPYVDAGNALGLIQGRDGGQFAPTATATRAEVTVLLMRSLDNRDR